jgi:hypothetical protein
MNAQETVARYYDAWISSEAILRPAAHDQLAGTQSRVSMSQNASPAYSR